MAGIFVSINVCGEKPGSPVTVKKISEASRYAGATD
jgi:hypothetical protein